MDRINQKIAFWTQQSRSKVLLKRLCLAPLTSMHLVAVFTVVLLFWQAEPVVAASVCGAPAYDPSTDSAVLLWKDCETEQWHARFTAGCSYIQYFGTVDSDQAFSTVVPVGIEPDDLLDYTSDPATISYRLGMVPPWEDGFDFTPPQDATVCFGVDSPAGTQALVGADRRLVDVPFNLETLGPCSPLQPTLSIADASVSEDAGTAPFTVQLMPSSSQPVTVDFATLDGTAVADDDYVDTSGGMVFGAGQTSESVTVEIVDDAVPEGDETFTVTLSNPVNATLGDASATGTIKDNELTVCGMPSYDASTDHEAFLWKDCDSGQWQARFTAAGGYRQYTGAVVSDQSFDDVVPVSIESSDVLDYSSDSATISYRLNVVPPWQDGFTFTPPGDASVCFGVDSPADTQVLVGSARTAVEVPFDLETLGPCSPPQPTLSITDISVSEGAGTALFTVQLTASSNQPVTVDFTTLNGTALAGDDYVAASGEVAFDAGQSSQPITVEIVDDTVPEGDETFTVVLSDSVGAVLGDASATGTIKDNELTVCGMPAYDASTDHEAFLWKDCDSGEWHARFTAGGGYRRYIGTVVSDEPFSNVVPVSIESNDLLDYRSDPATISYRLGIVPPWEDGFDFTPPDDATVCFGVDSPTGTQVLVGADRTPVNVPFDLESLGTCQSGPEAEYNFVVILTDDQRWDTLWAMPIVQDRLVNHGVNFTNAFITTPLCCPARASIYSGGYLAQNTGVLRNALPNGGPDRFVDLESMPRLLQKKGYKTMFIGKYFALYAGYEDGVNVAPYVPPGWTQFIGRSVYATTRDWWDFDYIRGSTTSAPSTGTRLSANGQYVTSFERDQVLSFLNTVGDTPFFVLFSTTAPHAPAVPASADETLFNDYIYRGRGYGETDLSDKPSWVRNYTGTMIDDAFVRRQLQSLQEVDRAVGAIVDKIQAAGALDRTVFIFLSDNGYMWGEHGMQGKAKPYDEAVRVPFVVRTPGTTPRTDTNMIAANLDLGATIFDLAGIQKETDGLSVAPLLSNPNAAWRNEILLEGFGHHAGEDGLWAVLRTPDWKFIDHPTGEKELYNLNNDPYELESKHEDPLFLDIMNDMAARLEPMKGLNVTSFRFNLPAACVGANYTFQLRAWGGTKPYEWSIVDGTLPHGLFLDRLTGRISGTCSQAGTTEVTFMVQGAGEMDYTGEREHFITLPYSFVCNQ